MRDKKGVQEGGQVRQNEVQKLPDGLHPADRNLFLMVRGSQRSWIFRMKRDGKEIKRGLGSAATVSLAEAKMKAERMRSSIRAGDDPGRQKKADSVRFRDIYLEVIQTRERVRRWKNAKHSHQWAQTIEDYALPVLGDLEVSEITRADVLRVLSPIWETKAETASRLRARLEAVFAYAIRQGWRERENPALWRGNLEFDLPSRKKARTIEHHEAPTVDELRMLAPRLMRSVGGRAILFGVLTASRVGEFVPAKWDEIDLEERVWSVPPERRKDGRGYPHRVPLCAQIVEMLRGMEKDGEYLFPGLSDHHIHRETPRLMLRKFLGRRVTMHGCRSTFRDWAAESGQDRILAEKALMHSTGTEVEQAYQRSDLLERRRPLMQSWADVILPLT